MKLQRCDTDHSFPPPQLAVPLLRLPVLVRRLGPPRPPLAVGAEAVLGGVPAAAAGRPRQGLLPVGDRLLRLAAVLAAIPGRQEEGLLVC